MISLNIDVTKIDKSHLFVGKKGTYLDCLLIATPNNEHNDYMIRQSVSKEEYEQGVKGPIIGHGKEFGNQSPTNYNTPPDATVDNSDIFDPPF